MQYRQTPAERELQELRIELRRRELAATKSAEPKQVRGVWTLYWTGLSAVFYGLYTLI